VALKCLRKNCPRKTLVTNTIKLCIVLEHIRIDLDELSELIYDWQHIARRG